MLEPLFWVLLIAALYSYFLYPLLLLLLPKGPLGRDPVVSGVFASDIQAGNLNVSMIITAYNEERRIAEKIENTLGISFNKGQLELIVASDCSDDQTDEIVRRYEGQGVRLVRAAERLGKENAQLAAIQSAKGDILVFSDVATRIPEDALTRLARYFERPEVGAVSSEDRFESRDGKVAGEGAYVKYEMWLRKQEALRAGLVGLSGSFFAARRTVCREWDIHSPSDFNTALNTARAGLVAVSAPDVLGYYTDLQQPAKEYQRKVRTALRGMTGLSRHSDVLNPSRYGVFAIQVLSHKVMRWLTPWFLLALLLVTLQLQSAGWVYSVALLGQLVFYGAALAAHAVPALRRSGLVRIIYYFVQSNIALIQAALLFVSGKRMTTWKPSAR